MYRWAVCTGLRRVELCNLKNSDLQNPYVLPSGLNQIEIRRKGGRLISVYVPQRLLDETRWYALTDRPSTLPAPDIDLVFLTKSGKPVDKNRLSNEFRKAANTIGSTATLHHLRHTYAVTLFGKLQQSADDGTHINPLKTLQILLGTCKHLQHRNLSASAKSIHPPCILLWPSYIARQCEQNHTAFKQRSNYSASG